MTVNIDAVSKNNTGLHGKKKPRTCISICNKLPLLVILQLKTSTHGKVKVHNFNTLTNRYTTVVKRKLFS